MEHVLGRTISVVQYAQNDLLYGEDHCALNDDPDYRQQSCARCACMKSNRKRARIRPPNLEGDEAGGETALGDIGRICHVE